MPNSHAETSSTQTSTLAPSQRVVTVATCYRAVCAVLDMRVFPAIIAYATHPLTITATMLLLVPLTLDASNTSLALLLGNYTNVCSAAVASIVLMQSMRHHHEVRRLHADLHTRLDTLDTLAARHDRPARDATTGRYTHRTPAS